jgi:hypothetical protein
VTFWLIPKPIPNRHMPAIRAAGTATAIRMIIPAAAVSSPGTSRPA